LTLNNVLMQLVSDGSNAAARVTAKLADFGLSRVLPPGATHASAHEGGTPFCVAPETAAHRRASPASDMYSYGVIMWALVTALPLAVMDVAGVIRRNPVFPGFPLTMPDLPAAYTDLMLRCLSSLRQLNNPSK
jgi:serine/threonine protein kinase